MWCPALHQNRYNRGLLVLTSESLIKLYFHHNYLYELDSLYYYQNHYHEINLYNHHIIYKGDNLFYHQIHYKEANL